MTTEVIFGTLTYCTLMRSGNSIHVQQHKTNMINEECNKTQNDARFVAFYDMRAVTFVLPDETADVSIAGLHWFILIPRLNHTRSHKLIDSHSIPYLHLEEIYNMEQELPSLLQSYELRGKQPFVSDFSRLLRHAIQKAEVLLYTGEKNRDLTGIIKTTCCADASMEVRVYHCSCYFNLFQK